MSIFNFQFYRETQFDHIPFPGSADFRVVRTRLVVGDSALSVGQVWNVFMGNETDMTTRNIVLSIRLVRVIVAVLIGVALSISGLQMQTVFRNPLADPYLLGVSSGSGLGVAFFILGAPLLGLAHSGFWQSVGIVGAGWGGAVMVLLLIAIISRYVKNILGVLIMGVMIGYIAGAIIQILQYLSSAEQLKMFSCGRWAPWDMSRPRNYLS